jgi:hypothetical protein
VYRHEQAQIKKKGEADAQVEVLAKITRDMKEKRQEEQEIQNFIDELYQEEAEQRSIAREKADDDKRERMKREMLDANDAMKALRARRTVEMQEEEVRFRHEMMDKLREDKRLEQMNAQRRRREMENYRDEVERLVADRRQTHEEALQAEEQELRKRGAQEAYRNAIVEKERQRLLRENAEDLQGYLPKGVLKDEHDYETVYGSKPKRDLVQEEAAFIRERNKRSTINLSGAPSRRRDNNSSSI